MMNAVVLIWLGITLSLLAVEGGILIVDAYKDRHDEDRTARKYSGYSR